MLSKIPRSDNAAKFGPIIGDRVRLTDTDLIFEIKRDLSIYGEEVKSGGSKGIEDIRAAKATGGLLAH